MADFFTDLASYLSSKLDADYLMIAALDNPLSPVTATTLMVYSHGEYLDNFQYELKNTPCENVVGSGSCVYPENVQSLFPEDILLADMDINGYGGVPLLDKEGKVNGILAAAFKETILHPEKVKNTLDTFSHWASAEVNRMDAETKLKESKCLFKTVFQLSPDVMIISSLEDGVLMYVNEKFLRMSGYSAEEAIGKPANNIGLWVDLKQRAQVLELLEENGRVENFEAQFRIKDGSIIDGLFSTSIVHIHNQPYLLSIVKDVTELKTVENELKQSEARYRELFQRAPVMLHSIDNNGFLVNVSNRWLEVLGYDRAEVIGRKPVEFLTEESRRDAVEKYLPEFFRTGHVKNAPYRFVKKSGELMDVLLTARCLYDDEGAIRASLAAITDIIELKKIEERLKESEEMFRTAFELNPDTVAITRVDDGTFVKVNDAFVNFTGYSRKVAIGSSILDFNIWSSSEARDEFVSNIRKNGFVNNAEHKLNRKDGIKIDGLLSSKIINLDSEPHLLTIVKDVTELQQAHEEARKSLVEKEVLLREIHHRVKNNMQVIVSLLKLQSREAENDHVRKLFEESEARIRSMSLVHEQLYRSEDMAHIDFQNYLEKLVRNVAEAYTKDTRQVTVTVDAENFDLSIDSSIPCGLIVSELVSNAYKYAFRGRNRGAISVRAKKDVNGMVDLRVEDDGIGVPRDFDPGKIKSLGMKLVFLLAENQLAGNVEIGRSNGTQFHICFKDELPVEGMRS